MSVGFLNNFYTQITESITAAGVIASIPDADYTELLVLDEDYVYCLLRDDENREIIIIDINASSSTDGLSIARGQESTVARAWPRGATLAQVITADNYGDFLQESSERSVGYDPTGVLSPQYLGEKVLQSTDNEASTRWWIAKNATDKKWLPLTETTDPGGGTSGSGKTAILNVIWTMEDWDATETIVYDDSIYEHDGHALSYFGAGLISKDTSVYKVGTASAKIDLNGDRQADIQGGKEALDCSQWDGQDLSLAGWVYVPSSINPNSQNVSMFLVAVLCPVSESTAGALFISAEYVIPPNIVTAAWKITAEYSVALPVYSAVDVIADDFSLGTWTHLACVLDSSATNVYIYINGIHVSTLDISSIYQPNMSVLSFLAGNVVADRPTTGTNLIGYFDDVRAYNYALTVAEILALPGF